MPRLPWLPRSLRSPARVSGSRSYDCGSFLGNFRVIHHACGHTRSISRSLPYDMPFADRSAAQLTEASAKSATYSPRPGIAHGRVRKICRHCVYRRPNTRNHPKTMPFADTSAAQLTESSERITTFALICGQTNGSIRENYRARVALRARFTETSANCATAGERSVQKAAQCRRTQKVGHAYACPTLTDAKLTASCADAPHAAH